MAHCKFNPNRGTFLLVICLFGSCIYFYEYYYCSSQGHVLSESSIVHSISRKDVPEVDKGASGYYFQACNCTKNLHFLTRRIKNRPTLDSQSQCSEESDWYGRGQRVVSYTLYNSTKIANDGRDDTFNMFADGILPNLKQMRKLYPGWIMRLYSNIELTKKYCVYACMDDVLWCDVRQLRFNSVPLDHVNPRLWRFMPLGDPTVDIFVSRDLDSLITEREREAVEDWENSSFAIHCTRDGRRDFMREMSAGCWGAKNSGLNANETKSVHKKMMTRGLYNYRPNLDEILLRDLIFYNYKSTILCHDSFTCKKYNVSSVPFPKQRKSTHVAITIRRLKNYRPTRCPSKCRPSYGKHWIYC